MLAGHYATALVAYQKYPKGTLLYFLIASQLQDLLWFSFHYLGLERTTPIDVFDTTVSNMAVNMLYSHDLIPLIGWLIIVFLIGKFIFKENKVGLVGSALVLGHFVLDFFSGHPHHIFGLDSGTVGLGNYATNVYQAIGIEAIATVAILWFFFNQESKNGVQRSSKNKAAIIGLFVFGIAFMLSIATTSFRELFGNSRIRFGVQYQCSYFNHDIRWNDALSQSLRSEIQYEELGFFCSRRFVFSIGELISSIK